MPLDYHPKSFASAWDEFLHIPYLQLGIASRADWVANIVLYIPLSLLAFASVTRNRETAFLRTVKALVIFSGCLLLAIGVEFAQLYFPARTVSKNDIIAETIGIIIGISFWGVASRRLNTLWQEIKSRGPAAMRAGLIFYALAYLAASLFPYDFVVSFAELSARLAKGRDSLFISPEYCTAILPCMTKFALEFMAVIPLGILIGEMLKSSRRPVTGIAMTCGAILGFVIEGTQIFLGSGVSQGVSVLTRAMGMSAGAFLFSNISHGTLGYLKPHARLIIIIIVLPYLGVLAMLIGWFQNQPMSMAEGLNRLNTVHFLPFYYHYYSTEQAALISLMQTTAVYAPIGLGYWGWILGMRYGIYAGSAIIAGILGGLVSFAVEASKLFLSGEHPDPTNVLIAIMASAMTYRIAVWLTKWSAGQRAATARANQARRQGRACL
ncbi:MAG: VanZ family protein [Gammaproteobacteria bacterium]